MTEVSDTRENVTLDEVGSPARLIFSWWLLPLQALLAVPDIEYSFQSLEYHRRCCGKLLINVMET